MSSSLLSFVAVSAMATVVMAYDSPYECPESKYTALIENYQSGEDDQYTEYLGVKAPYNWDVNHCGKIQGGVALPGTIHYPPHVEPLVMHMNDFVNNPHGLPLTKLFHNLIGSPFFTQVHEWFHSIGNIDWDQDGVVDWNIYGSNEIDAVNACRNKWFSNNQPGNFKLRRSAHQVKIHRPRNCSKDPSPQFAPGTGSYSPLNAWDNAGVPKEMQRRLTFTILNKPANPKYIAFFVNGLESCKGYPQGATGSDDGWKHNVVNKDQEGDCSNVPKRDPLGAKGYKWHSGDIYINKHGSASLFMAEPGAPEAYGQDLSVFPKEETLVIVVPDASFGYPDMPSLYNAVGTWGIGGMAKRCGVRNSANDNAKLVQGWVDWLDHHVAWSNIEGFLGVGASRGGCFVTLLADKLFKTGGKLHKSAKLILETLDPVCGPRELDAYRHEHGYAMGGTWTQNDKTILAASPLSSINANLVQVYPAPAEDAQYPLYRRINQCYMMKIHEMFKDHPREDIRWLNTISGEDVLGEMKPDPSKDKKGVAWTGIHSFCSDFTAGPAQDPNGNTVSTLYNNSIGDTLAEDIKPRGIPINERFTKNEDGQPVIPSVKYQNLWLDFDNVAHVSGDVTTGPKTNPFAFGDDYNYYLNNDQSKLTNSNNPMPGFGSLSPACGSWYKQYWVPHSHMTVTGGVYVPLNRYADGVGVPCFGQASCGYGVHEPQDTNGNFPLPLQKRSSKVKACIPFPRADMDYQYKHAKHAHDAWVELSVGVNGHSNGICGVSQSLNTDQVSSDSNFGRGGDKGGFYSDSDIGSGASADGKDDPLGDIYGQITGDELVQKFSQFTALDVSDKQFEDSYSPSTVNRANVDGTAEAAIEYYDKINETFDWTDVVYKSNEADR